MHELSIAMSIIDLAREKAAEIRAGHISRMEVDVSKLTGVDSEALALVLESVIYDSEFSDCHFEIRLVDARCKCNICLYEFPVEKLSESCPHCGSSDTALIAGRNLQIKSFIVD